MTRRTSNVVPLPVIPRLPAKGKSSARKKRFEDTDDAQATKTAILTAGNVIAGAFDFLDGLEKGQGLLDAGRVAIKKAKRRAKAIKKVEEGDEE